MPTYEYICRSCGHLFEIVQSMRDASLTECPECGGELRKVFAPPAIAFKGSGFYATDQRKKATTGSGEKAEKDDKKDAGSDTSDGKKDSKSDAPAAGAKKEASTSSASSTSTSSGSSSSSPSKEGSDS
ncbi:MAG TPA: FmdB family zinc ribbon protein [Actinomycetota bacterium]